MRRQYDEECKRQTARYILEKGKSVTQTARELDISKNTINNWVKKYKQEPEIRNKQKFRNENHQLSELQKRIRYLEEENAILKKAMHILILSPCG
ncbi:transposase [Aneurinibacillus thermoaerophilus]|uniref:transposase n=1 Tax=Aneurinibacillus thermoaerophilus TaxID=143495 RepID=UPI002E1AB649|nr:transposase [Aneurinibacillus thermoaerophilus]MED0679029.1 transposase [Aneurinibacillus thermoaerophilus]